ncbi:MAG: amidase [Anaerolineales bacterium]|nr:amidase [Anaerolineales bacterium]
MHAYTILELQRLLREGELTCLEIAAGCLRQIQDYDKTIHAFITVLGDAVLEEARQHDLAGMGSDRDAALPLYGIPVGLKDLFATRGVLTTAGSKLFADHVPEEDACVVEKLKAAGALLIGKHNLHEIALGVTNINPHYGPSRNPWDLARITGGSSGGSAAAVLTGMCLAALGTDTGGSIRIPSALCGIVGLKPTCGRVSLRGVLPLSWNLDHAGPLARRVQDVALLYSVIAGYDPHDPASVDVAIEDPLAHLRHGVRGWRVALAVGKFFEAADAEILAALHAAARAFAELGARVEQVDLSWLEAAARANGQMTQGDAAAVHRERLATRPREIGADVLRRLEAGAALSSTEYALARRTQVEMRHRLSAFFAEYEILLTPTVPVPAPLIEGADSVQQAGQLTRFTAPFNLTGVPALSVPCGFTGRGLPIGLQIVGRMWSEAAVLRAGQAYEQAAALWHTIPEIERARKPGPARRRG